jgi:hypothetical protein
MLHILFVSYFDQCFQDIEHKDLGMVSFPQCFIHFTVYFFMYNNWLESCWVGGGCQYETKNMIYFKGGRALKGTSKSLNMRSSCSTFRCCFVHVHNIDIPC